jgi:predicted dehydrogenase
MRVGDVDRKRLAAIRRSMPDVETVSEPGAILDADDIDAVVICTPAVSHHEHTVRALKAGKHVLVEKPLALKAKEAADVARLAARRGLTVMVGHLLLYHPAVLHLKKLVDRGTLGEIRTLVSRRVNLGRVRADENALWSLAPHDVSLMIYLAGEPPATVSARAGEFLRPGVADVVFMSLAWRDGRVGQVHVSWLDQHKERTLSIVGSRRMAVFDDMEAAEKIRIYDKGVNPPTDGVGPGEALSVRFGDVRIPHLPSTEPLHAEYEHFLRCIRTGEAPRSDASEGLGVVRVLEAASESMRQGGTPVRIRATRSKKRGGRQR